jgi:hypothetical protein
METFRGTVPDDLHPAGLATIWVWIRDMIEAAEHDDAAMFARFAILIAEKVDQELESYEQGRHADRADTHHHPKPEEPTMKRQQHHALPAVGAHADIVPRLG